MTILAPEFLSRLFPSVGRRHFRRIRPRATTVRAITPPARCRLDGYDRTCAARSVLRARRDRPNPSGVVRFVLVALDASAEIRSIVDRSAIATIALTTVR